MTDASPPSTRRLNAAAKLLRENHDDAVSVLDRLDDNALSTIAEAIRQLQRLRAIARGDLDDIIGEAFEVGFGSDGLGVLPWIEGTVIVCPGAIVTKNRGNHRCRFVSVDDTWIWDSHELIREDKRSTPGALDGFRAVALLPILNGMQLDVVSGKARGGQHGVEKVISYEVRKGDLVEVAQRTVTPAGMQ